MRVEAHIDLENLVLDPRVCLPPDRGFLFKPMPTEKDGFVMYKSEYESIEHLSDQDLGSLTRAIYKYQISGEIPPKSNPLVFGVFMFFKVKFDRDDARYAKVVERNQKNGQKGGRPPAPDNQDVEVNPTESKEPTGFSGIPDNPTEPKKPDKEKEQDTVKEKGIKIPFEDFWNLYDKKDGRKGCALKWSKLSLETQKLIMEDVPKYKASVRDARFLKLPSTYLNGEHWTDERKEYSANPQTETIFPRMKRI